MAEDKYFHQNPVRWKIIGNQLDALPYRGEATKLLWQLKNGMKFNDIRQGGMTRYFEDGTVITARSVFGQDFLSINVPSIPMVAMEEEEIDGFLVFYIKNGLLKFSLIEYLQLNSIANGTSKAKPKEKDALENGFDIQTFQNNLHWPFIHCCVPFEYLYETGSETVTKNIYIIGLGFKLNPSVKSEGPLPEYENYSYLSDGGISDPMVTAPSYHPVYFYVFDPDSGKYYYLGKDEAGWWATGWSGGFNVNGNKIYYHDANESLLKVFQLKDEEIVLIKQVDTNWENGLFVSSDGYFYGWYREIVGKKNTSWYPGILYELTNHDLTHWVMYAGEEPKYYMRLNIETEEWEPYWYDELISNSETGTWRTTTCPLNESASFTYSQIGKRWYIKSDGKKLVMDYILYDIDTSGTQEGVYTSENLGGPPEHPTTKYHFTLDEIMSGSGIAQAKNFAKVYTSFSRNTNKHVYYTYTQEWDPGLLPEAGYKVIEITVEDNENVGWTSQLDLGMMRFPFLKDDKIFCQLEKNDYEVSSNIVGHWTQAEGYVVDSGSRSYGGSNPPYYLYSPYEEFPLTRPQEWIEYGQIYSDYNKLLVQSVVSGSAVGFNPIIYFNGQRIEDQLASCLEISPSDIMCIVMVPGLDKDPNRTIFTG